MTISKKFLAIGVLCILVFGIAVGKFAVPSKVIERDRIVTSDRDTELTWHAYVGHTETKAEVQTRWKTVTKWEKDGSVSQTVVAAQDEKTETKQDVVEQEQKIHETVKTVEVVHEKIVEAKKPDWILGARIGVENLSMPIYGGEISRRIVGPVFLDGWGEKTGHGWAIGTGIKLLF